MAAAAACVALLAAASPAVAEDPPLLNWNPLLPGLPQTYQPSKDADCVDGNPACIEQTLTEMYRRFDASTPAVTTTRRSGSPTSA